MTDTTSGAQMVTALVRLREALQGAVLPLALPGVEAHRLARTEMVDQLEDYVIPRIVTLEAPLLAVVGGSTGAGKSTLVNSLVGAVVTESACSARRRARRCWSTTRPTATGSVPTGCSRAREGPSPDA